MSGRFIFRLDAALQQRARQEQVAQVAMAQGVQAHAAAVAELTLGEQALAKEQQHAAIPGRTLDMEGRLALLYYLDRAESRLQQQRQVVQQRAQACQRLQGLLIQAAARRRALEKLRERRLREFQLEEQRRSDQQLDEQATLRYTSQASQGRKADAHSSR